MADEDITWGAAPQQQEEISWHAPAAAPATEPADHGLSERQKLSPLGKAISPITGYWDTYQKMRGEAYNQAAEGIHQMTNPDSVIDPQAHGLSDIGVGALKTAAGGFNYLVGSPVNAAYRSIAGQPIEDVTGIPREYTEFAGQLATPGIGFARMPRAPGAVAETMPKIKPVEGPDLTSMQAETNRALAREFDVDLTRGQATGDLEAIRREDMAARGAYGKEQQDLAAPRFKEQFEDIQNAGQRVGQTLNRGEGPLGAPADAAATLNTEIGDTAQAARAARDAATARAEQDATRVRQEAADRGNAISERIAAQYPQIDHPLEAGEMVGEQVRATAARDRAAYGESYREAYSRPGEFRRDTFTGLGDRIRNEMTLSDNPMIVDQLTPAATGALNHLDNVSNLRLVNRADPRAPPNPDDVAAINLQGLDRARKVLQSYYRRAATPPDRAATSRIISEFDGQVERSITEGLFSGDTRALEALQRARSQFRDYQRTYFPREAGDDVGAAMRRIVQRNATPEEISNMIVGSGKIGSSGGPVRIADRLELVLGGDSPEWNAIRQAMWQKASQVRNVRGEIDPFRSATSIQDFTRSTLGRRMFPDELEAMRAHAQGSRDLEGIIENLPSTRAAQSSQENYQRVFGGEGLSGTQRKVFNRMVDGTATREETAQGLFNIIGGGNPGDASRAIAAVERVVGRDSPVMGSVRQGIWQKLTQNPFGKDQKGQQMMVQAVNEFLNGKGAGIAKNLYSAEERALMNRYAEAVRRTIIPKYSRTNSDTAVASAAQAHRQVASIASAVSSLLHLGPIGHLGGHAVSRMIGKRMTGLQGKADLQSLGESLNDVIPKPQKLPPPPGPPRAFRPVPLAGAIGAMPFDKSRNPYAP